MKQPSEIIPCEIPINKRFHDLTGKTFGRLKVIGLFGKKRADAGYTEYYWNCGCVCGGTAIVKGGSLASGNTESCGCYHSEKAATRLLKHGMSESSEYRVWKHMHERCRNPKSRDFKNYGGRGITVCDRWSGNDGFVHFKEDMGPRPEGHSIERRNNDKGYSPDNCYWATRTEQSRNTRQNRMIECWGQRMCATSWYETTGIKASVICDRLALGWTPERALSQPVR